MTEENKKETFAQNNEEENHESTEAEQTAQHENQQQEQNQPSDAQQAEEQSQDNPDNKAETSEAEEQITALKAERDDYKNRLMRVQADMENFRRRTREEKQTAAKYKSQSMAEKLLDVVDNFERGLNIETSSEETQSLLDGMDMVYRQLKDVLEAENVEVIEADGQPFDPNYHQAIMQVESEDEETDTVVETVQKGYKLNDRVLRPAMVKVAQ